MAIGHGRGWLASRGWWAWLAGWSVVGLIIRVATVLGRPHRVPAGDAYYYHYAANLLVSGHGFINPFLYFGAHRSVQTASFPPGYVLVLSAASVLGLKSFLAQRIWSAVIGAAAVAVCGLAGREIAGPRAGLVAAGIVAVYPNIWMADEVALSESLTPILVALVLLAAYRFWKRPQIRTAVWLGLAVGAAALTRDELAVLGLLVLVPLGLTADVGSWRRRLGLLLAGLAASVLVVAPWVAYNMSRFQKPVYISSGLGITLASANCAQVYSGPLEGYWSMACAAAAPIRSTADESVQGAEAESFALRFVRSHDDRAVPVVAARIGRAFGLFHPLRQIGLDSKVETRPYHWALLGLGMYYVMVVLSIGGTAVLRRRRVPVTPLFAVGATVVASVVLAFGDTRYRISFEVVLVLLSAVFIDWWWARLRPKAPGEEPAPEPDLALTAPGSLAGHPRPGPA